MSSSTKTKNIKFACACGSFITNRKQNISAHKRSQKHKKFLKKKKKTKKTKKNCTTKVVKFKTEKFTCGCGSIIANKKWNITAHKRTAKHFAYEDREEEKRNPSPPSTFNYFKQTVFLAGYEHWEKIAVKVLETPKESYELVKKHLPNVLADLVKGFVGKVKVREIKLTHTYTRVRDAHSGLPNSVIYHIEKKRWNVVE